MRGPRRDFARGIDQQQVAANTEGYALLERRFEQCFALRRMGVNGLSDVLEARAHLEREAEARRQFGNAGAEYNYVTTTISIVPEPAAALIVLPATALLRRRR